MTDLNKFFKALSERAYKENGLSDVTYSMCESNKVFRQFFLDFFLSFLFIVNVIYFEQNNIYYVRK